MATYGKLVLVIFSCMFGHILSATIVNHSLLSKIRTSTVVLERHQRNTAVLEESANKRESVLRRISSKLLRSRRDTDDTKCKAQYKIFKNAIIGDNLKKFISTTRFVNETKTNMAVVWAGQNNGRILVAVTQEFFGVLAQPSSLYHSKDDGRTFTLINSKVNDRLIRKDNGLLKNNYNPLHVIIVVYTETAISDVFITENGGDDFTGPYHLPFMLVDGIDFHPKDSKYMLAHSLQDFTLYLSQDGGRTWTLIHEHVYKFAWHDDMENPSENKQGTIYVQTSPKLVKGASLQDLIEHNDFYLDCTDSFGTGADAWHRVHDKVFSFQVKGRFLFASTGQDQFNRFMKVSTDSGRTWNAVQLPTLTSDRFYSIMDMSEEVVFMHVDQPGETGFGKLYVSDTKGIVYSESLDRHLYPNHEEVTDFYRVESMSGVYITSQIMEDKSIHTLISFDKGAEWKPIKRPVGVACKDEAKACNLQIHNAYSVSRHIPSSPPLSIPTAPGIILVHGHIAEALQTSYPDVYVTNDGGYTWIQALKGPHHYQIADHGGLLVAVPADTYTPTVVKFSTDEGRCWHEYKFTNETIIFTGLLTEPGGRAMSVSIWGYGAYDHIWRITVIDFLTVIPRQCQPEDYQSWTAHLTLNSIDENFKGCLLGARVTYTRLKVDSWCHNGYPHEVESTKKSCTCRREDYECDYGYYRPEGSDDCVLDHEFKHADFNICEGGHVEELISKGYRKVAGDSCTGGFHPPPVKNIDMSKKCGGEDKELVKAELMKDAVVNNTKAPSTGGSAGVTAVVIIVVLIVLAMLVLLGRKFYLNRRHITYRYSSLSQSDEFDYDNDFENALVEHATIYEDTSDDETLGKRKVNYGSKSSSSVSTTLQPVKKVKSYHDDSDVDMLE